MYDVVAHTAPLLPEDRPRYLMGTGMPDDLIECVARGIDLFDCVLPTRNARNGQLLTSRGPLVIKNARYAEDMLPPDPDCSCYTCRHFSGPISATFLSSEKCRQPPSTRCIISTFTLTRCGGLGRL